MVHDILGGRSRVRIAEAHDDRINDTTVVRREYSLVVQEAGAEAKPFVLVITNESFISRFARYQDGPDICYQKLMESLASEAPSPQDTSRRIVVSPMPA